MNIYQKYLWYPISYQIVTNHGAWQSIYFVAQIPSIWFTPMKLVAVTFSHVLYLTKSCIIKLEMPLANFLYWDFFGYIICFLVYIDIVFILWICETFFVDYRNSQGTQVILRCLKMLVSTNILHICPIFTLYLSNTILPVHSYQLPNPTPILKLCQMII